MQQLYNSPINSTKVQFLNFPMNDSGAFDSTAFNSGAFDSTAFDSTAFDSSMFDFGFLEVLKFMEKEEGTTGMMVFCICNVIILFLLNMDITKIMIINKMHSCTIWIMNLFHGSRCRCNIRLSLIKIAN